MHIHIGDALVDNDFVCFEGLGRYCRVSLKKEWQRKIEARRGAKSNLYHHSTRMRFYYQQGRELKYLLRELSFSEGAGIVVN